MRYEKSNRHIRKRTIVEIVTFIQHNFSSYTISQLCSILKFPRSTYYKVLVRVPSNKTSTKNLTRKWSRSMRIQNEGMELLMIKGYPAALNGYRSIWRNRGFISSDYSLLKGELKMKNLAFQYPFISGYSSLDITNLHTSTLVFTRNSIYHSEYIL